MDESELELGLGLSLGAGGGGGKAKIRSSEATRALDATGGDWDHGYDGITTADDFSSVVPAKFSALSSSSSSSSSTTLGNQDNHGPGGTKRTAEPSSPPCRSGVGQVVGWPPIRNYRVNNLINHTKSPAAGDFSSTTDKCNAEDTVVDKTNNARIRNYNFSKAKGIVKTSFLVKVNMDGFPIGRKIDLNAHNCYETLAQTLDNMFTPPSAAVTARRSNVEQQAKGTARLLGGSFDWVLTYEDKDGDWMLAGDIPWEMFLGSVKRLRIMRTIEANGLAPRGHEKKQDTVNSSKIK